MGEAQELNNDYKVVYNYKHGKNKTVFFTKKEFDRKLINTINHERRFFRIKESILKGRINSIEFDNSILEDSLLGAKIKLDKIPLWIRKIFKAL